MLGRRIRDLERMLEDIETIHRKLEDIRDEEQSDRDNVPEKFMGSEGYRILERRTAALENAYDLILDVTTEIQNAIRG